MGGHHRSILVSGYAQAPKGTCLAERVGTAGVVLVIDPRTDTITDAEFMLVTDLAKRFCREEVVGYRLTDGVDPLLRHLSEVLLVPSQQALIMALRSASQRYLERTSRRSRELPGVG